MNMNNSNRKSLNLLPNFFRTEKNSKFLSSTLDQFIQSPKLERLYGYAGSKFSKNYNPITDTYILNHGSVREAYQLEPGLVVKTISRDIKKIFSYDDLINRISTSGSSVTNLNRLFEPSVYSYNPQIDWDKFVNFREYYWMPVGPSTVTITGTLKETNSTYTVTDSEDKKTLIFNNLTPEPVLTLYRGVTYVFNVSSDREFYIKWSNTTGSQDAYENVVNNGTKNGQLIFSVNELSPAKLYYTSGDNILAGGEILIRSAQENSVINVEQEVIGKAEYTSGNGVKFVNGLKISFSGDVIPSSYRDKEFVVEGVGDSICLVDWASLQTPGSLAQLINSNFDGSNFDQYPFDDFKSIPIVPEYVTINKSSRDLNPWSRYNRWFHSSVINLSAEINGVTPDISPAYRASRPIIEFKPNLQLYNFGTEAVSPVDFIDVNTEDAFSVVEGSAGYYVDGILLEQGNRVIFNSDNDPLVRGRIYEVNFEVIDNQLILDLVDVYENKPEVSSSVVVRKGSKYSATEWWFDGSVWQYAQQRTMRNQSPKFDLFDDTGESYNNSTNNFAGNNLFGYAVGTGTSDSVLGFPLKYRNVSIEGAYLFENFFSTQKFNVINQQTVLTILDTQTYIKSNSTKGSPEYLTVWNRATDYKIPVIQFEVIQQNTDQIKVSVFDKPGDISDLTIEVFVNDVKYKQGVDYTVNTSNSDVYVSFIKSIVASEVDFKKILLKFFTSASPKDPSSYEIPLNLVNNPLNESLTELTFSELSDHVKSMVYNSNDFVGTFPGSSNLKDLPDISQLGTQLVSLANPLSLAQYFIADPENSLISATRLAADRYNQFKLSFLQSITTLVQDFTPSQAVDYILVELAKSKNVDFPYKNSDMIGYGSNLVSRTYTVTSSSNTAYAISQQFDLITPSNRSIIVYLNGEQLIYSRDYTFSLVDPVVQISKALQKGDQIVINDYYDITDVYIPPTPTKLGLYPKFIPELYLDSSYANGPQNVIQGHDGSIMLAFNDYRDNIILELEKRIFNNIKVEYRADLINIDEIIPNAFRNQGFTFEEIQKISLPDFLRWASVYGLNYQTNEYFDLENSKTYNYSQATDSVLGKTLPGYWRGIFSYYFGTDRPHTHPWEMLGIYIKPTWWDTEYGPAPYTSGNMILWQDLEAGVIKQGPRAGQYDLYAKPGLSSMIPVDDSGNLIDIRNWGVIGPNSYIEGIDSEWKFGDYAPVEAAWRKSSYWPFVLQIVLALTKPADYAALMFDTSKMSLNKIGQWVYGDNKKFISPSLLTIDDLNAGYSVYVAEAGKQRISNYINLLSTDLTNCGFNLMYKLGGFASKDKLSVVIDSVQPSSASSSALIPQEDYSIFFNSSIPARTVAISGLIIEKVDDGYKVRGYDKQDPFFTILSPIHSNNDTALTVGGVSEQYYSWKSNTFYQAGQAVRYQEEFFRVAISHTSSSVFDSSYFSKISKLSTVGGSTVITARQYETEPTNVMYGTTFRSIQEVYDLIAGYGQWLINQGFEFNDYNAEMGTVVDWNYTIKEFLFWTTQNWAATSIITLSPFANTISYRFTDSVVDNVFDSFYEYSLMQADGKPLSAKYVSVDRQDGICKITNTNQYEGFFFARLNLVQKEHVLVLNNRSMFNDVIYDANTGYRQRRVKLSGFRTSEWNGEYFFPGFVYDPATITDWQAYREYQSGDIVRYVGKYYSSILNVEGKSKFDFADWSQLGEKPVADLLPNFDYKINQFEDFYSLDIDNFDVGQQKMAQHLIGYTPRSYLNNIFTDPIAQYKFYQGYIREKGTKSALDKLVKASVYNLQGRLEFSEEWAFRVGSYGSYLTYREIELPLEEGNFVENPQIVKFINDTYETLPKDLISYVPTSQLDITPDDWDPNSAFVTTSTRDFVLGTAGYVRIDDVTSTAYDINSLFDVATTKDIIEGSTVWVGFKENGDWDVYRYTKQAALVSSVTVSIPGQKIILNTDINHKLSVGDIISVSQYEDTINGVYVVDAIPAIKQLEVSSSANIAPTTSTNGLIFKFESVRLNTFDDLSNKSFLNDISFGEKIWVDNLDSTWAVYEKVNNYSDQILKNEIGNVDQRFGYSIACQDTGVSIVVSAPNYSNIAGYGRIFVYDKIDEDAINNTATITPLFNYGINSVQNEFYEDSTDVTGLGISLEYDEVSDIIVAGAPLVSKVKSISAGSVVLASATGTTSTYTSQGVVKISKIDRIYLAEKDPIILVSPNAQTDEKFGASVAVSRNTGTKTLLVGAPGGLSISTGTVYGYRFEVSTSTIDVLSTITIESNIVSTSTSSHFGSVIVGDKTLSTIAISAPGYDNMSGAVCIYSSTATGYSLLQTITVDTIGGAFGVGSGLGYAISMSDDGMWLSASSKLANDNVYQPGKVAIFKRVNNQYTLWQVLHNPASQTDFYFGTYIDVNPDGTIITVAASGSGNMLSETFIDSTLFDSDATWFSDYVANVGTVYVYNRYKDKFIFGQELFSNSVEGSSAYAALVSVDSRTVLVGAPDANTIHLWEEINPLSMSWQVLRKQEPVVDISKVRSAALIDSVNMSVKSYIDIFDPVKGKIPGLADQEIRFKTPYDPAIYSIGGTTVVADTSVNWIEDHVGELWWDLSTVKYVWYEQGDLEFRKNNWGNLFTGSTIDVYEWVESQYLPSEWASLADTPQGLSLGMSGQPKFADDSIVSVKQIFNSVTNSFSDVYYFWVKNKVTLPNNADRKISAHQVQSLIIDPKTYGLQYCSPVSANALIVANVKATLQNNQIHLNIIGDEINNPINKHTEWMLIQEGNKDSMPNELLEKKLFDSLLGKDSIGNVIPDPSLSERMRYGISIRPRQGMFKDRKKALRNLIEYTNSVLLQNQITDYCDLTRLVSQDAIPASDLGTYDVVVEDNAALNELNYNNLVTALLSCSVTNGKVTSVVIDEPGSGYLIAPTVTFGDGRELVEIKTYINEYGQITGTNVISAGSGYVVAPDLKVRPFTAIVQADSTSNGKWSKYNRIDNTWAKVQTQKYDTTLYWYYADWKATDYNQYTSLTSTIGEVYELDTLDLASGDYVKIKNAGDSRYIIVRKAAVGTLGTFNAGFDLMYVQKGTLQFSNNLWNYTDSVYGFDQTAAFDQTLYDQTPDIELSNILLAIKNDLFINDLTVEWNKFFFSAVKYALTEQKFVDWAFKTSFISVRNLAGSLDQRPVYKFQNSENFENYLNEVKPYHTNVRNYTLVYDQVEPSQTYTTDFDLPVIYDNDLDAFRPVSLGEDLMSVDPYKAWADNYKNHIASINVYSGGSGYTELPFVNIIPAYGDTPTVLAKAEAYISLGKITEIIVTEPGEGYTKTPVVIITGGGSTDIIPARAYAQLANDKVRSLTVNLTFDRISRTREIGNQYVTDTLTGDGNTFEFILSWAAYDNKDMITVTVNGYKLLIDDYTIVNYTQQEYEYTKQYSKLVLTNVPAKDDVIEITYPKSPELYNSIDRIEDYYYPTAGMPGLAPDQLMSGLSYPGITLETLPFDSLSAWDTFNFGELIWDDESAGSYELDTVYLGGSWNTATSQLVGALGINPSDITLDGDRFISPNTSYAPEELVPGQVRESFGINVFTRTASGSPLITSITLESFAWVASIAKLSTTPPTIESVFVWFDGVALEYGSDYTIDFTNAELTVYPLSKDGIISVTVIGVGGSRFVDNDKIVVFNTSTANLFSAAEITNSRSIFVTVNGRAITASNTSTSAWYSLSSVSSSNLMTKITVHNLPMTTNTIQSWAFESSNKGFSEVKEQSIILDGITRLYDLTQPPGISWSAGSQIIVELNNKRLTPPSSSYHIGTAGQIYFDIDRNNNYPLGVYDMLHTSVFVNGVEVRKGIDFTFAASANQVKFVPDFIKSGDSVSITTDVYADFTIRDNKIVLLDNLDIHDGDKLKVITFTNQDADFIMNEVFEIRASKTYPVSRSIVNDDFVWVSINGSLLINKFDYYVLSDGQTIKIRDDYPFAAGQKVVITSFNNTIVDYTLGYRLFKDILGRTQYKRLSKDYSTYLAQPLSLTDTTITLVNADSLALPNISQNIPGVILINGERIEYFEKSGNVLSRISRSTMGTGARDMYPRGTLVVDQSNVQTIPFEETTVKQTFTATTATNSYSITDITFLSTSTAELHDQVEVYYGGRLLFKPTPDSVQRLHHDNSVSYDATTASITVLAPEFTIEYVESTPTLILNIEEGIVDNTRISVVQRKSTVWTGTESLLTSPVIQAEFLRLHPSSNPDKYFYGQL